MYKLDIVIIFNKQDKIIKTVNEIDNEICMLLDEVSIDDKTQYKIFDSTTYKNYRQGFTPEEVNYASLVFTVEWLTKKRPDVIFADYYTTRKSILTSVTYHGTSVYDTDHTMFSMYMLDKLDEINKSNHHQNSISLLLLLKEFLASRNCNLSCSSEDELIDKCMSFRSFHSFLISKLGGDSNRVYLNFLHKQRRICMSNDNTSSDVKDYYHVNDDFVIVGSFSFFFPLIADTNDEKWF
jgi:hypothetical protein